MGIDPTVVRYSNVGIFEMFFIHFGHSAMSPFGLSLFFAILMKTANAFGSEQD